MNKRILEATLLTILLLNIFRTYYLANPFLISAIAVPLIVFIFLSLPIFLKSVVIKQFRFLCFWLIILILFGFMLSQQIFNRFHSEKTIIYDGSVQTEFATSSFLAGKNPYTISFEKVLKGERFYHNGKPDPVLTNYPYSPLTFLINTPFLVLGDSLFKIADSRITNSIFFLLTAVVGTAVVGERLLFLIIFLLNPLMVHGVFLGANDVLPLFFVFLNIALLYLGKTSAATVSIALATGTKLTPVPFVPIYFLWLFFRLNPKPDRIRILAREIILFIIISLLIYLPFMIWNFGALFFDLITFHLGGGGEGFPIVGFLGLPHLLAYLRVITPETTFPLYLIQFPLIVIVLIFCYYLFKKSSTLTMLSTISVLFFLLVFSTSRVFMPNYLDFISGVLVLASFVKSKQ